MDWRETMAEFWLYVGVGIYLLLKYWSSHVLPILQEIWLVLVLSGIGYLLLSRWFWRLLAWPVVRAWRGLCLAVGWRR